MKNIVREKHLLPILLLGVVTIAIFNGVLSGKLISNVTHLFHFPPWVHLADQPSNKGNFIMSDMVDGAGHLFSQVTEVRRGNIPMWDYSEKLGVPAFFNMVFQWNNPLKILWVIFDSPVGWTLEILLKFWIGSVFTYLYLKRLNVDSYLAVAFAIGFTFGVNNIGAHQAGFSSVPLALAVVLYLIERLIKSNSWTDVLWLLFGLLYYAGTGFVSVMFFGACWVFLYVLMRVSTQSEHSLFSLLIKFSFAALLAILLLSPFILETLAFFNKGSIDLSYRDNYGNAQLPLEALLNFFGGFDFGHPLHDFRRWRHGSFINTGVFVGIITIISALTFGIVRAFKKREPITLFFVIIVVFLLLDIYRFPFEYVEHFTNKIPGFHGNRPTYQKPILQLFVTILGALGLDLFWKSIFANKNVSFFKRYRYIWLCTCLILFAVVTRTLYVLNKEISNTIPSGYWEYYYLFMAAMFAGFVVAVLLSYTQLFKTLVTRRTLGIAVILFFVTEALVYSIGWISYSNPKYWFPETPMTKHIGQNLESGRVVSFLKGPAIPAMMSGYGFPVAAGRGSVDPHYRDLLQTVSEKIYTGHPTQTYFYGDTDFESPVWDLIDVRYVITDNRFSPSFLDEYDNEFSILDFPGGKLVEAQDKPQHYRYVSDGLVLTKEEMKNSFAQGVIDVKEQIVLISRDSLNKDDSPQKDNKKNVGTVTSFQQLSNKFVVETETIAPGYLVISSQYNSGWKAFVNNQEVPTFPAYGFLLGINIKDIGHNQIEIKYLPQSWITGRWFSGIGVMLLIALSITVFRFSFKNEELVN